jgi:2-phospho-L-lactate guanylyltransferase (CobY/MobA/RfbA family)
VTRPPGVIPYRYGIDSFRAHLEAARRERWQTIILSLDNLEVDIDEPSDLRWLLNEAVERSETTTWRYLAEIGLAERLTRPAG